MSSAAIVMSPDEGVFEVSTERFVEAVSEQWPQAELVYHDVDDSTVTDVTARITDWWQVFHDRDGDQLRCEGDEGQQLEFAAWARTLVPAEVLGRLLLLTEDASVAATLRPGMSPAEIAAAWHETPEW